LDSQYLDRVTHKDHHNITNFEPFWSPELYKYKHLPYLVSICVHIYISALPNNLQADSQMEGTIVRTQTKKPCVWKTLNCMLKIWKPFQAQ